MAGHVANLATMFEDPTPIRSWFMSHNVSRWLPLKMRKRHRVCAESRERWALGWKPLHFLESPIPICLRIIDFHRRHYNTLALLCECVITVPTIIGIWQLHLKTVGGLRFCNTVYMYVIKSKHVQEAQLSPSDRAMPLISSNLANYHATVQKLLIRQVLTKRWYEVGGLVEGNVSWTNQRRSSCVYHLYTDDLLWRNFVKSTIYL